MFWLPATITLGATHPTNGGLDLDSTWTFNRLRKAWLRREPRCTAEAIWSTPVAAFEDLDAGQPRRHYSAEGKTRFPLDHEANHGDRVKGAFDKGVGAGDRETLSIGTRRIRQKNVDD